MTLDLLTADALHPLRHAFFTRRGGASSGVYSGLNCGAGSGDQAEIVAINRARAAAALDLPPEGLIGIHQVHSADVITVRADSPPIAGRGDALVTNRPGLALAVLTADCMPVLFADPGAGVIGAAHAGWRGALSGVLESTVEAMITLGARLDSISAVIGPCISQRNYEVGPEVLAAFEADDPDAARHFAQGNGDRLMFDLPGLGLARLRAAGVGHAEWTRHCTYADPDRFYSYRRSQHQNEPDYGRLISAIRL